MVWNSFSSLFQRYVNFSLPSFVTHDSLEVAVFISSIFLLYIAVSFYCRLHYYKGTISANNHRQSYILLFMRTFYNLLSQCSSKKTSVINSNWMAKSKSPGWDICSVMMMIDFLLQLLSFFCLSCQATMLPAYLDHPLILLSLDLDGHCCFV